MAENQDFYNPVYGGDVESNVNMESELVGVPRRRRERRRDMSCVTEKQVEDVVDAVKELVEIFYDLVMDADRCDTDECFVFVLKRIRELLIEFRDILSGFEDEVPNVYGLIRALESAVDDVENLMAYSEGGLGKDDVMSLLWDIATGIVEDIYDEVSDVVEGMFG